MLPSNNDLITTKSLIRKLQTGIADTEFSKQSLYQKQSELAAILKLIPDVYFRLSADGVILDYKPGNQEDVENFPEIIPGRLILEYLVPDVKAEFNRAIAQALRTPFTVISLEDLCLFNSIYSYECRLMSLHSQQIILLIREKKSFLKVQFSQEAMQMQNLLETADNIIFVLTNTGEFSCISPNLTNILGHELSEVIGQSFISFVHPDDQDICTEYLTAIINSDKPPAAIEYRVKHKDGSWQWQTSNISAIKDANGNVVYYPGISQDITPRKLAEQALQEKVKLANFRDEVDAFLAESSGIEQVMHGCAKAIVKHLNAAFARIWILNKQENVLELQVSAGMYTHIDGPHRRVPVGQFKIGLIAAEGKPHLTNSVQTDPRVGDKEWATREGMVAFAGYPLMVEGEILGVIAMFARHTLSESTFEALRIAAREIAIGIKRKQTEAALRQSEAKFREIAQKEALINRLASQIRGSLELNAIVETAVHEIYNLFQIDRCAFWWYRQNANVPGWEIVYEVQSGSGSCLLPKYVEDIEAKLITEKILNKEIIRIDHIDHVEIEIDVISQKFLCNFGFQALMCLPVKTPSGEIGAFMCGHCSGARPWLDSEVELLTSVTDQLAIAIDQAKLYTQSRIAAQTAEEKAQQLAAALLELQQAQVQLIHSEKMSSLGQLVAGIAHEINNPVNFIYGNINHTREYIRDLLDLVKLYQQHYCPPVPEIHEYTQSIDLDFLSQDLPKILNSMNIGAERIRQIVLSLRNFSRLDEDGMKLVDIHEGIDSTLLLLQNRLKAKPGSMEIQVVKEYGNLPNLFCHAGQMNQVFMNLLTNAIDALEEQIENGNWAVGQELDSHSGTDAINRPQILISTELTTDQQVIVRIADNGPGMTEEVRDRLFDPFFTTKPVGKGTGMGLSISYQIVVSRHQGRLECISAPGKGAAFVITIPLK